MAEQPISRSPWTRHRWGAARVEGAFNLIGSATAVAVDCAAKTWGRRPAQVRKAAKLEVVGETNAQAALEVDCTDPEEHQEAIPRPLADAPRLREWALPVPEGRANGWRSLH